MKAWADAVTELREAGLYRRPVVLDGPTGPRAVVEGREVLVLASNDYLGLAAHPAVLAAAREALEAYGAGSGGARLTTGTRPVHRRLEADLAAWKGAEDAVLFGSGYLANAGTIPALVGRGDVIFSDELNHASIIDGCRLSGAAVRVYRHADPDHLAGLLAAERAEFRHALIVTDGVFSMDGDLAPLPALCELAGSHDARLMVDDAHATGVLGETGAGTAEHWGLDPGRLEVRMGTLSKALGAEGGFVAGSTALAELLRNRARTFIFATAPTPAAAAAARAAAALARAAAGAERRRALRANAAFLRGALAGLGLRVPPGVTPIIPVHVGEAARAAALAAALLRRGVFVPAIRPPAVPPGTARLRVTVSAAHTRSDLEEAVAAFAAAIREAGLP